VFFFFFFFYCYTVGGANTDLLEEYTVWVIDTIPIWCLWSGSKQGKGAETGGKSIGLCTL